VEEVSFEAGSILQSCAGITAWVLGFRKINPPSSKPCCWTYF